MTFGDGWKSLSCQGIYTATRDLFHIYLSVYLFVRMCVQPGRLWKHEKTPWENLSSPFDDMNPRDATCLVRLGSRLSELSHLSPTRGLI